MNAWLQAHKGFVFHLIRSLSARMNAPCKIDPIVVIFLYATFLFVVVLLIFYISDRCNKRKQEKQSAEQKSAT